MTLFQNSVQTIMMPGKNMATGEQGYNKIYTKNLRALGWNFSSKYAKLFAQVSDIGPSWSFCLNASWRLEQNLERGSPNNISAKLYWNWSSGFWQKYFQSVLYSYKALPPNGHVFWRIMTAWTNLEEGHQRNIPAKLYWNHFSSFWQEYF